MSELSRSRFAVIGNPVAHSMSPLIHQAFADQFGINLCYEKILAEEETFQQVVDQFFAEGGKGLNITTPFKSLAAAYASDCSAIAKASNSVNTLFYDDAGNLRGDSTDGRGWLADIRRLGINLIDKNVLVIGAGGAARIIINTLLSEPIRGLHICNRTEQRATALLEPTQEKLTASGLDSIPEKKWDLVVNSLSAGWQGEYPDIRARVNKATVAYDLNYGRGADSFRQWFFNHGGKESFFHDGWGMLVEQAAESFNLWWKCRPSTDIIINAGAP